MAQYNQWMHAKLYQAALGLSEVEQVADRTFADRHDQVAGLA
ncbi:hypothetical protein [Pseudomonas sp.]